MPGELVSKPASCDMAAPQRTVVLAGDEGDSLDLGTGDVLTDELGADAGEVSAATFLPGSDERAGVVVVDEGRARSRESEPAPRALDTSPHRPRPRRSTPLADGWCDPNERASTPGTEIDSRQAADRTALRQKRREEAHAATVRAGG